MESNRLENEEDFFWLLEVSSVIYSLESKKDTTIFSLAKNKNEFGFTRERKRKKEVCQPCYFPGGIPGTLKFTLLPTRIELDDIARERRV